MVRLQVTILLPIAEHSVNYGAPDEFSSDGGPQFTSTAFTEFLQTWGLFHCLSSVSYPQSNDRAEAAVKTAKCIVQENTASNGSLNTDRVAKAIMQYCNTPYLVCHLVLPRYSSTECYMISHQPTLNTMNSTKIGFCPPTSEKQLSFNRKLKHLRHMTKPPTP